MEITTHWEAHEAIVDKLVVCGHSNVALDENVMARRDLPFKNMKCSNNMMIVTTIENYSLL
jgi:hypothetical protein